MLDSETLQLMLGFGNLLVYLLTVAVVINDTKK